jgi:hypothetical protein
MGLGDNGAQIMDPKMDSGLLEPEYELFDAWKPRLPEEIIGIMDRLLCNEVCPSSGHEWMKVDFFRWHGTLDQRSRKPFLRVFISTSCSLRVRSDSSKQPLEHLEELRKDMICFRMY